MHATQRKRCQARARPQKKACRYGVFVSGKTIGEYDNGSAKGAGRTEYIWLPTEGGGAIPIGIYRNSNFFAVHTDHLGTPRLMTNKDNKPVWQWPYSAFGNNKPTGILKATPNPKAAITNIPVLLKATTPTELALRFPGQTDEPETGMFYNLSRSYWPMHGAYPQMDSIGMRGGLNRRLYVNASPLMFTDPLGLQAAPGSGPHRPMVPNLNPQSPLTDLDLPNFSPTTQCNIQCGIKNQWICTAGTVGMTLLTSGLGGSATGGACFMVKTFACYKKCQGTTDQCEPQSLPPIDPKATYEPLPSTF